jgi:hypothetical protein
MRKEGDLKQRNNLILKINKEEIEKKAPLNLAGMCSINTFCKSGSASQSSGYNRFKPKTFPLASWSLKK